MRAKMRPDYSRDGERAYVTSTKGRGTPYLVPSKAFSGAIQCWRVYITHEKDGQITHEYSYAFRQRRHAAEWTEACGGKS